MNRYRRSLSQAHHSPSQGSELSLGHSGAGPSMYFIEESEPKRPNIISRGKMRNSSPPQSSTFVVNPNVNNALTVAGPQSQQINYQLANQNSQHVQQQKNEIHESQANLETFGVCTTNCGAMQPQLNEVSVSATSGTVADAAAVSEAANMALDAMPFHLLSDESTQTFLNSGQFETIETEDGNVLLILKEDIENPAAVDTSTIANSLSMGAELAVPAASNYSLIDHDVTTCTPSIESPISSVGVNTSVVQQQQQQIEQLQQQHQLDSSLIQLTQQQLETIDVSEQIIVTTSDSNGLQPQTYLLLSMSDGTQYLLPTDNADGQGAEGVQLALQSTETIVPDINTEAVTVAPSVPAAISTPPKPKVQKPKPAPVSKPAVNSSQSTPFKIQLQSQPPPLVPVRRKDLTPAPAPDHHKPYRFIMSEEAEERRETTLPMNPFVVKVLSQTPVSSPRPPKEPVTSATGLSSPPKLILKTSAYSLSTTTQPKLITSNMVKSLSSKPEAKVNNKVTFTLTVPQNSNANEVGDDGVIDLGNGLFKCTLCEKKTKLRCNMVNHINRSHKGERPYPCPDCGETFEYASTLRSHHQKAHVIKVFKCVPCTINFASEADLKTHFTSVHSTQKNIVVVSSSTAAPANNSMFSSPDIGKFTCEQCKKQYTSKNSLMRHKIEHWDMSNGNIPCDECKKDFPSKVNYLNHVQAHKDSLLEHTCEICAKGFKTDKYMKNHVAIHRKTSSADEKVKQVTPNGASPPSELGLVALDSKLSNSVTPSSTPIREPPVIKFLSSSPIAPTIEKSPETLALPKAKRQVFLCSRCDVIFTTSDQLKSHFDEKHPDLIGKQQVVLKSTRVPAAFLEKRLSQQKLDSSQLSAPTSPAKILESLKGTPIVQGSPKRLLEKTAPAPVPTSPPKSSTNNTTANEQKQQQRKSPSPVKVSPPRSPVKVAIPSSPVKVAVTATSPGSPVKVPTSAPAPEEQKTQSPAGTAAIITDNNPASPEKKARGGKRRSGQQVVHETTVKSMAAIAQVQMENKMIELKQKEKSGRKKEGETPPPSKRGRKSSTQDEKVAPNSESPKGQSPSPKAGPGRPKSANKSETTPPPPTKRKMKTEAKKSTCVSPSRVSTRQNKGQSSRHNDFEFYGNNQESDVGASVNASANATTSASKNPAGAEESITKRKPGRPPKRPAKESAADEKAASPSPTKTRRLNARTLSPDITASSPSSQPPSPTKSNSKMNKVNQTNGRGGRESRIATRGSSSSTGRQK